MSNELKRNESLNILENDDDPEELLLDNLFQDLHQYNKIAFEESDSEDEKYERNNRGSQQEQFPSVNVLNDIGPLSRSLLKLRDEKLIRKKLSKSYMHNYWK